MFRMSAFGVDTDSQTTLPHINGVIHRTLFQSTLQGAKTLWCGLEQLTSAAMLQHGWKLVLNRLNERHCSEFAADVDELSRSN